jgi:hypothetical protein
MTQRQEFTVIQSYDGFELREYLPCSIAEVKVSADYSSAGSVAFRSLFGYISQYVNHIDAFGLNSDRARFIRLLFQPLLVAWALGSTGAWSAFRSRVKS